MSNQDWIGDSLSVFRTLGASNHSTYIRQQHDYYATEPKAVELLLAEETFSPIIWECACGEGHLSKAIEKAGYSVISTDVVYRGFGCPKSIDFLDYREENSFTGDIITNPPYKYALEFVEQAIRVIKPHNKIAMFLKLTFLEGRKRKEFFKFYPPKIIYVSSSRLICAINGDFEHMTSSAVAYAWFVWQKGFLGDSVIKWIN